MAIRTRIPSLFRPRTPIDQSVLAENRKLIEFAGKVARASTEFLREYRRLSEAGKYLGDHWGYSADDARRFLGRR